MEDFEPVFDNVPTDSLDTEAVFDTQPVFEQVSPEPKGFIDSTYGTPEDNQSPEFQAKVAEQVEVRRQKRKTTQTANAKLDDEVASTKKYVNTAESELVEASFLDKGQNFWSFGSRNFTDDSLVGYTKRLEREQKDDGLDPASQESRQLVIQTLKDKGATDEDLRALSMGMAKEGSSKVETLDVTSKAFTKVAGEVMGYEDSFALDVVGPALSGLSETGIGLATVALDAADIGNTILDSKVVSEDIEEQRQYLETLRADVEARKVEYKERYNKSSAVNAAGKFTPMAILAAYNPSSIVAIATVEGAAAGTLARGEGFSKSQAAAQAMVASVLTGAIVKVGDLAPKALSYIGDTFQGPTGKQVVSTGPRDVKTVVNVGDVPTAKVITKKASRVNSLEDLPTNLRSEVDKLQRQNGWSDEMVVNMINGYAKGAESGAVNAQDLIRQMASKGRKSSEEITDLMLRDPDLKKVMTKEINMRTQNILKHVKKKSPLGKIIYANSNKLTYEGTTSINWTTVYNEAQDAGIDVSSSIMRKLEQNKHLYGDMDLGYHNTLRNADEVVETPGMFQQYKNLAVDSARLHLKLWMNKQMGIGALPSFNIVNRSVDLLEQTFLRTKINKKLQATVMQSIVDGPIKPSDLKKVLKQQNPRTTDDAIDEVVEAAVNVSQSGKRTALETEKEETVMEDIVEARNTYTGMRRGVIDILPNKVDMDKTVTELAPSFTKVEDGFYANAKGGGATIEFHPDKTMTAEFTGLQEGSGQGAVLYHEAWDAAEKLGYKYVPGNLSGTNEVKLSSIMLKKMALEKRDLSHIIISKDQLGGHFLGGQPLTKENAVSLANTYMKEVNKIIRRKTDSFGIDLKSTDSELQEIANVIGDDYNLNIGIGTLKLLAKFEKTGKLGFADIMTLATLILGSTGIGALLDTEGDTE